MPQLRRSHRASRLVLAASAASLGALATAGLARGAAAPASAGPPCPATAKCGSVPVPLDRSEPGGPTISIAYAFLPRLDTKRPSLGTVAPNPGGPGVSTVGQAELYTTLLAPLRKRRELLLIDARGTGGSAAIRCSWDGVDPLATTPSALGGLCLNGLGEHAGDYGSAAVADDIDAVRASLGVDKLDLWGDSYGTFLMPVYAARHPDHVRSIVLDGAFPVAFDPWGRDVLASTRRVIGLVCKRSGSCSGSRVLKQVGQLAAQLRERPLTSTVGNPKHPTRVKAGERDLASLVHAGGDPTRYRHLPKAVDAAAHGDTRLLKRLMAEARVSDAEGAGVPPELFSLGAAAAVACHDYPRAFSLADPPAKRRADYAAALAQLPASDFEPFSADAWLSTDIDAGPKCLDTPVDPTAGSPLAGAVMPDVPVLVQSGDLDTNTPIEQGRAAAAQFPNATFAVIANAGHTPDLQPCGLAMGIEFVERLKVDAPACRHAGSPPVIAKH